MFHSLTILRYRSAKFFYIYRSAGIERLKTWTKQCSHSWFHTPYGHIGACLSLQDLLFNEMHCSCTWFEVDIATTVFKSI